jgi:transposase-like protein
VLTIPQVIDSFGTTEACLAYIEQHRWPDGPACLRCGSIALTRIETRHKWECRDCHFQFRATVGTIFHNSKVELPKWFLAVHFILSGRKGYPAKQLARDLGLPYKTCWSMLHRIRKAMANGNRHKLAGTVEMDETYVKCRKPDSKGEKRTRKGGSDPLTHVVAFGMRQRRGEARIKIVPDTKQSTVFPIIEANVRRMSMLHTDEGFLYKRIGLRGFRHRAVQHATEYVDDQGTHCNGVESLWAVLKRGRYGVYHKIGRKYAQRYCDEVAFRINHNGDGFRSVFANCENGFDSERRTADPKIRETAVE